MIVRFWTDGSCVGLSKQRPVIGWSAVWDEGVVVAQSQVGGTNVNAEAYAIRDLLKHLSKWSPKLMKRLAENNGLIEVVSDSKTVLQIISGMKKDPKSYESDMNSSKNYQAVRDILTYVGEIEQNHGVFVEFVHVHGHEDNIGNAFADWVATQQSQQLYLDTYGEPSAKK